MAFEQKIGVAETSTTTGTGSYALGGALSGRLGFSVHANGATVVCKITMGTDWEFGLYTYSSGGGTLARTAVLKSTNSDAAVNWGAGTKTIREVDPALGDASDAIKIGISDLLTNIAEATVASASTCDILGAASNKIAISGTTTITSFGTGPNRIRFVRFTGALTLTHNGTSLILPGAANITTVAGDTCVVIADASSNCRVLAYQRGASVPAGAGANSDITSLSALASVNEGPLAGWRNLLINPDGRFLERAPASNADNTYGHDRWVALTQTSTIAVSTVSDAENGTPRMARLTQSQASAQRMGYAQWIEGANCRWLRGKNVTLSGRIKFSLNAAIRYAICEWTGTEDTPSTARDIVNDWTSGTYTAGNFFKSTTFNVLAVGSITPSAATLTDLTKLTAAVGSSCNNLVVFIWTEGTAAQNATLDVALQLEVGSVASRREFRPKVIEKALCNWYYQRKQAAATNYDISMVGYGYNTNVQQNFTDFYPEMRKAPGSNAAISSAGHFSIAVNNTQLAATGLAITYAGRSQAWWTTLNTTYGAGVAGTLYSSNASAWIEYDAEI